MDMESSVFCSYDVVPQGKGHHRKHVVIADCVVKKTARILELVTLLLGAMVVKLSSKFGLYVLMQISDSER